MVIWLISAVVMSRGPLMLWRVIMNDAGRVVSHWWSKRWSSQGVDGAKKMASTMAKRSIFELDAKTNDASCKLISNDELKIFKHRRHVHDVPKDSSNVKQMHTIYTLKVACSCCDTDILDGVDGRNQDLFHDVDGLGCACRLLLRSWWQSKLLCYITLLCDVLIPPRWIILLWVVVPVVFGSALLDWSPIS